MRDSTYLMKVSLNYRNRSTYYDYTSLVMIIAQASTALIIGNNTYYNYPTTYNDTRNHEVKVCLEIITQSRNVEKLLLLRRSIE